MSRKLQWGRHSCLPFANPAGCRAHPPHPRPARINPALLIVLASVVAVAALIALLVWNERSANPTAGSAPTLVLYCAAGVQPPIAEIDTAYEKEFGTRIQAQFDGSGTLLGNIQLYKTGDLFLAADQSYIDIARSKNLLAEVIPLARQTPVIAVKKGNPKNIKTLADLLRQDVKISLANPDAASIGKMVKKHMEKSGQWKDLEAHVRSHGVFKPTVNNCANDVKLGAADASILWDATVKMYPELEASLSPAFENSTEVVSIGVLKCSKNPTAALRFARYVGASDKGLKVFAKFGYQVEDGDEWALTPRINLYSGAMLRPAIEKTLKDFETREGVQINTTYNGCGILTAAMRAGQRPDAYFSCDTSFMNTVADLYLSPLTISDNDIMIIVAKGNPKGIKTVADLARPDVRLGLAHSEKSAMGKLTKDMLVAMNQYEALDKNKKMESNTGDLLVNSLRTGALDAIVACRSNYKTGQEFLEAIPIDHPLSKAAQPYAVGRNTKYKQLMTRLMDAFISAESKERFVNTGFGWRVDSK